MTRIYRLFFSPALALLLLLMFALAMAVATFIENDFGTDTAWIVIYDTWWFELLMLGLGLCFIGNINKYKLWKRSKWPLFLFHLAFIIILLGASITRYTSYSGIMRIREGKSNNIIISDKNYLHIHLIDEGKTRIVKKALAFSLLSNNDFTLETDINNKMVSIAYNKFIPDAIPQIQEDLKNGKQLIEMVVSSGKGRETIFLEKGELETIGAHKHKVGFEVNTPNAINIIQKNGKLHIKSPRSLSTFEMATENAGTLKKDSLYFFQLRTLYRDGDVSFVPLAFHPKAVIKLGSDSERPKENDELKDDAILLNVKVGKTSKKITLLYREGFLPTVHEIDIEGVKLEMSYGASPIQLPFSIHLNDFQLERYPGSTSPSAYASEVKILDHSKEIPYRIFMNNVLDYQGYRFFQASYDTDELGTVLSVTHDNFGTNITYIGYTLMILGMFFSLFGKSSRITLISKKLKNLHKGTLLILCLFISNFSFSQAPAYDSSLFTIEVIKNQTVDEQHAQMFGRLLVQDLDGRIKPINTLASECLRKLTRKPYFKFSESGKSIQLSANQTFLAMQAAPNIWQHIPLIKVDKKKGGSLYKNVKVSENNLVAFVNFFDKQKNYLLSELVENANKKKPAQRSEFDKEVIKVDERFNVLYNVFIGNYLKIFPNSNDKNNTWYSYTHHFKDFPADDGRFASQIIPRYYKQVNAKQWVLASEKLEYIKKFQEVLGETIIPSPKRVEAELLYNKANLNFWLFQFFFSAGAFLLLLAITKIFITNKGIRIVWNTSILLLLTSLVLFSGNIILRWYIAEHPPWSNGYEMLIFVGWGILISGFFAFKKSDFALPLATLFSGALLFVGYLDWLNPEITNLMPVLKSFWLKVHVAIIVSSYAPLALGAILGFMALLLIIFKTEKTKNTLDIKIKELTYINEISITIGLFLLAVGTFLGGVWANESWGRYWAWDPKETWALISIIVYAIVLHLRFVPKLQNLYTLNVASVFAFSSIIMTSFGVNYYLSGLHSYATGDPLPIPTFIYVLIILVTLVSILAYLRNNDFKPVKSA